MDESHLGVLVLRDARELFEQPERRPPDEDYEPWCVAPAAMVLGHERAGGKLVDVAGQA
jgi:hypothetical protein